MTSPTVKLICGALELNLNDQSDFGIYPDFTPPDIAYTVAFAGGTSANTSGGAELANKTVTNTPFSFRVNVLGNSDADIRKNMARIKHFLSFAEDQNEPLYLEFNSNSNIPRPLWGQGFFIRYQIAYGTVEYEKGYMVGASLSTDIDAVLNIIIKGYPVGLRQRLGSAMGRIVEDVYGAADGVSKGLHISPSITNKMTNPVFGASTWNTGWTADASLTASQNTDARFVLPGAVNSAKLFSRSTGQEWYQSINAGNTNAHTFIAIICLPDLGTPSSSDCQLFYNAALTTTFVNLGNGFWRLTATAAGINAATNTGVQVKNGRAVYLCYFGMIEGNNGLNYQPIWGDHLGCAWSGTAHASTSTSTAGRWRQAIAADTFDYQQGALRIVWTPPMVYTSFASANYYLFDAGNFIVFFDATNDVFTFYDGTNSASIATTFAADTPIVIHCVWGPSGKLIYINGVSATNTYTPPSAASYFYLGSSSTPSLWAGGVFGDLAVWGVALTATQVANDYANVAQLTADNQRVGCVPWLWTKDGDDVVDNCDDSTRDNWAVCGGVPGSAEAVTTWKMSVSQTPTNLLLANLPLTIGNFADLGPLTGMSLFYEGSGTAGAGTDSNSDYRLTSVSTSAVTLMGAGGMFGSGAAQARESKTLYGREFFVVCRLYDEDNTKPLSLMLRSTFGTSGTAYDTPFWAITTAAANRLFLSQYGIVYPSPPYSSAQPFDYILTLMAKRSTGTANVRLDWVMAVPRPFCVITNPTANGTIHLSQANAIVLNGVVNITVLSVAGDEVNLQPEKLNLIISVLGNSSGDPLIASTNTFSQIDITPRYTLL